MSSNEPNMTFKENVEIPTENVIAVDIEKVDKNPYQPRREIEPEKIEELARSIKECGLIQPIVVRRFERRYQLVVGERRLLACRQLGWKKISASVKVLSENDMATLALIENLQRENLNYIEEALGYTSLMKNFGLTQEILAKRLGKSQSTIANKIRLLKLSGAVQKKLLENGLSERHARAMLKIESAEQQAEVLDMVIKRGLTVNQAEKLIDKMATDDNRKERLKKSKPIIRDLRIVLNTIREAVAIIESAGLNPEVEEIVEADFIEVRIRLSKEMIAKRN